MFTDKDITRIGKGVRDCTLPKSEWTHAAHIAAAVWLLDRAGARAEVLMPDMIRRYNEATGVANTDSGGYHHTITLASLRKVELVGIGDDLASRVEAALSAGLDRPDWLLAHYTRERLFSVEARRGWAAPDLRPLA